MSLNSIQNETPGINETDLRSSKCLSMNMGRKHPGEHVSTGLQRWAAPDCTDVLRNCREGNTGLLHFWSFPHPFQQNLEKVTKISATKIPHVHTHRFVIKCKMFNPVIHKIIHDPYPRKKVWMNIKQKHKSMQLTMLIKKINGTKISADAGSPFHKFNAFIHNKTLSQPVIVENSLKLIKNIYEKMYHQHVSQDPSGERSHPSNWNGKR